MDVRIGLKKIDLTLNDKRKVVGFNDKQHMYVILQRSDSASNSPTSATQKSPTIGSIPDSPVSQVSTGSAHISGMIGSKPVSSVSHPPNVVGPVPTGSAHMKPDSSVIPHPNTSHQSVNIANTANQLIPFPLIIENDSNVATLLLTQVTTASATFPGLPTISGVERARGYSGTDRWFVNDLSPVEGLEHLEQIEN